jgi:nucleoside-diphosphate-sugar epimerase
MKILLLGGTGAMGNHLVDLVSKTGAEVTVSTRNPRSDKQGVRYIQGNAREDAFLDELIRERWDVIVDFMVYSTEAFKARVKLLLGSTGQYIYLSSARVYADSENELVEDSKRLLDVSRDETFLATDEYALAKARQENILFNSSLSNWTIIRPYITYSEERLQLGVLEKEAWLYRAVRGRTIIFSKDIATRFTTMTYGLDVAKGITAVMGIPKCLGEAYHITTNKSLKWSRILEVYAKTLHTHLGTKPLVLLQDMERFRLTHPGYYQIKYDRLYNRQFNNSKIRKLLTDMPFMDPEDGLTHCLTNFLNRGEFLPINWRMEAKKDRQTGEWAALSEQGGILSAYKYLLHRLFY